MAGRFNARPRFQRKPKDWVWVPKVVAFAQGTTALFTAVVLPVDWRTGTSAKDRATYYGTRGTISVAPIAAGSLHFALGADIVSTFDPSQPFDYVDEGDIFWSYTIRVPATPAAIPIQIPINIKSRRLISTAGDVAIELVTIGSAATMANVNVSLHSLVNRA